MNLKEIGIDANEIKELVVERLVEHLSTSISIDDEGRAHKCGDGILKEIKDEVANRFKEKSEKILSEKIPVVVDEIFQEGFQPVDSWGRPTGKPTTLREMAKSKFETYLTEKVDRDGRTSYGADRVRWEWALSKAVSESFDHAMKKEVTDAIAKAKTQLRSEVAKFIVEQLEKSK